MQFIQYDLGQLRANQLVNIIIDRQANVLLLDDNNYLNYKSRRRFQYYGGLAKKSPVNLPVPRSGHWYVVIDLAGAGGSIQHSVNVMN